MHAASHSPVAELPAMTEKLLADLVEAAQECLGDDLISVVLFGSGAEGRLRSTSDLNLLIVLRRYEKERIDAFREPLRVAGVAGNASAMFILEQELPTAAEVFAVKFDDIRRRHRILFGTDLVSELEPSREAKRQRLRQVLMNLALRLRERYAALSLREEQLVLLLAEVAGSFRSAAATLLELEGRSFDSPKEALEIVASNREGSSWQTWLGGISRARESRQLAPGEAAPIVFQLLALADAMRRRAERIG